MKLIGMWHESLGFIEQPRYERLNAHDYGDGSKWDNIGMVPVFAVDDLIEVNTITFEPPADMGGFSLEPADGMNGFVHYDVKINLRERTFTIEVSE